MEQLKPTANPVTAEPEPTADLTWECPVCGDDARLGWETKRCCYIYLMQQTTSPAV